MVKITADVTNKELDASENQTLCWNLCNKHKAMPDASEEEMFGFTQTCKKCLKINRELTNKNLHLWSKLVTAYLKATKKRRNDNGNYA